MAVKKKKEKLSLNQKFFNCMVFLDEYQQNQSRLFSWGVSYEDFMIIGPQKRTERRFKGKYISIDLISPVSLPVMEKLLM